MTIHLQDRRTANLYEETGFDVDIANALCDADQAQVRVRRTGEQAWDSMIPGLQAKKYDVIISSMSITEERLKWWTSLTSTTTHPARSS
jgi:ABC-type amino acid transport substrate-binding protein